MLSVRCFGERVIRYFTSVRHLFPFAPLPSFPLFLFNSSTQKNSQGAKIYPSLHFYKLASLASKFLRDLNTEIYASQIIPHYSQKSLSSVISP